MNLDLLKDALPALDLPADEETISRFEKYRSLVLSWNDKVNLTGIKDPIEFEKKHFIDSLLCAKYPAFLNAVKIVDVGTGAGFPGLPLAICFPDKEFVLVDSQQKKLTILSEIIDTLGVKNARTIHGRAEDLANNPKHRERYDLCLSRAVADLSVLSEYCMPFVKVGGYFAAYKTLSAEEEIKRSENAIGLLGGKIREATAVKMPGASLDHQIIWIEKTAATPEKYPRKAGTPEKSPL